MSGSSLWKANSLVSLELRDGTFVLLQMLDSSGWIAALDHYRNGDDWSGVVPSETDVLFITCVLRSFLKRSRLNEVKGIQPIEGLSVSPGVRTRLNTEPEFREVTLWPGTEDEITVLVSGGEGHVGLHATGTGDDGESVDQFQLITPSDYKKYEKIETSHLGDYPVLNERLLLCRGKGWNFDPMRNLIFDWPLDRECSVYAQIISGSVRLDELGYAAR